ncbi:MAG: ATP-binding protein, partial [Bacteroidota bacterium]
MVAEATKSKPRNVFEARLAKNGTVRLLNAAVIYGPNASGKSNVIKALFSLSKLVTLSDGFKIDSDIPCYEPFLLDLGSKERPTRFELSFIGKDEVKYIYTVEFGRKEVFVETLDFYPKGQQNRLFSRQRTDEGFHELVPGGDLKKTGLVKRVLKNQLLLSRYGTEPHEQLNDVYRFFQETEVVANSSTQVDQLVDDLGRKIIQPRYESLKKSIESLVNAADTKIAGISVTDVKALNDVAQTQIFTRRSIFEDGKKIDEIEFDLKKGDSIGTRTLVALGGLIYEKLQNGGLVVIDELDSSLHPKLTRYLVQLFSNPEINTKNAQLIFTTHQPLLMEKEMFRSDQIWFTDKNDFGETELYSAQHFDGVREDIPFDKWYMAGKFGALP